MYHEMDFVVREYTSRIGLRKIVVSQLLTSRRVSWVSVFFVS